MKLKSVVNFHAIAVFLGFLGLWQVASQSGWIPPFLFPAPSQIFENLLTQREDFSIAFFQTLKGTLFGFGLSLVIGTVAAMLFSVSTFLKKGILPFAVFFQTVPIIAVAPLLVIYFGFGLGTVVMAAFIVSLFPIIANTLLGLENVDQDTLDLFKLYQSTPWQVLTKLRVPAAYSSMYAGWKVALGLAIIGAVAGEFVAGGGLGAMIDAARTQQRIDIVFGALLLLSLMGLALILILQTFHWLLQKHRPYGRNLKG